MNIELPTAAAVMLHHRALRFSFVTNPLTPIQETVCLLQNETSANNPSAVPKRAVSTYYMVKLRIRSGEADGFLHYVSAKTNQARICFPAYRI